MSDSDNEATFIREGLQHYSEAMRATSEFRRRVGSIIRGAIVAEDPSLMWLSSKDAAQSKVARDIDGASSWISVSAEGTFRGLQGAWIEVGLTWGYTSPGPHLYGNFTHQGQVLTRPSSAITRAEYKRPYLFRPISLDAALDDQVHEFVRMVIQQSDTAA